MAPEPDARVIIPPRDGAEHTHDDASSASHEKHAPRNAAAAPLVVADALTLHDARGRVAVREASFAIAPGEIVGVAAVEGSGQRELLRALAGRHPAASGRLALPATVGFIPEDRHRDGLALDLTLTENVALRGAADRRGLVRWRAVRERTEALVRAFDVRAPGAQVPARALSGGNQQKLVLARELAGHPALVVAENPTRGLDVRATAAVQAHLRAARDRGAAVVVYSSDLDEVLALATRVLAVYAGRVREVACEREAVGRAMLGAP